MKLINLMPMLIKIVELDFSWPLFNSGLHRVALGLKTLKVFTVAGTVNAFNIIPHQDSVNITYINKMKFVNIANFAIRPL